ncbi:MAG: DsrE family protein [Pseudomonadota bacterium]
MKFVISVISALFFAGAACAQPEGFAYGPLIKDYGPVAAISGARPAPEEAAYQVSFDVKTQAEIGTVSRSLESGARFLNMHAAAGVSPDRMKLAFVIHGAAVRDVTHNEFYSEETGAENASLGLIKVLQENGVDIFVCGQSAAYYGVSTGDLAPGVEMALSAMTMHAELQQRGYTLNPF